MIRMKFFIGLIFISFYGFSFSQELSTQRYFVQSMVSESFSDTEELVNELRNNPYVFVVRYDANTRGLLIVTKELDFVYTREVFLSWLGDKIEFVGCIRVGLQSVDAHVPFPLTNCED